MINKLKEELGHEAYFLPEKDGMWVVKKVNGYETKVFFRNGVPVGVRGGNSKDGLFSLSLTSNTTLEDLLRFFE